MNERWLSVEEIAAHLGVNPETIYKWIVRKSLPGHKVGKFWKFLISEVDEWVKAGVAATSHSPIVQPADKKTKRGQVPQ
jgi:excisionase family DNA binding protein